MKSLTLILVIIVSSCSTAPTDVNKPLPPIPQESTQTPPEAPPSSWKFWQQGQSKGSNGKFSSGMKNLYDKFINPDTRNFSPKKALSNMYYKTANAAVRTQVYTAAAFGHDHDQYGALGRAEQRHADIRAKTNVKLIGIQNAKENGYAMNDKYWNTYDKMFKPNNGPMEGTPRPLTAQVPSVPTGSQVVSGEARRKPVGPRDAVYASNNDVAQRSTSSSGSHNISPEIPSSSLDLEFSEEKFPYGSPRPNPSFSLGSNQEPTGKTKPIVPSLNLNFQGTKSEESSLYDSAGPSPARRDTTERKVIDSPSVASKAPSEDFYNEETLSVGDQDGSDSPVYKTNSLYSAQSFEVRPHSRMPTVHTVAEQKPIHAEYDEFNISREKSQKAMIHKDSLEEWALKDEKGTMVETPKSLRRQDTVISNREIMPIDMHIDYPALSRLASQKAVIEN